jgi:hypothetical protein
MTFKYRNHNLIWTVIGFALNGCATADQVVWRLDNLQSIGGQQVTVTGDPKVINTPNGRALEFDGVDDGIFLDVHPLQGMSTFTVEVVFNPYADGSPEQRFFHMQQDPSEERVMFETRLVGDDHWFLDTFVFSNKQKVMLYADDNQHVIGTWYHAAIVVNETSFSHFVNGRLELSKPIEFVAPQAGRTSLGVRINKIHWFKGAIRTVRFTSRVLAPDEFLTIDD